MIAILAMMVAALVNLTPSVTCADGPYFYPGPCYNPPAPVPELSTLVLVAIGLITVLLLIYKRKRS